MDIKSVESIKQLIAEGKTENAITQFLDNIHDDELKNDLIVISGKFQKIKREQNIGIEDYDKISQEKNKINNSLLQILNSIKIENITQENESDELKNLKIKIQEKINGLYAIDTEYWGEIIKISDDTIIITYNLFEHSRDALVTPLYRIHYFFMHDLWYFIKRFSYYFLLFILVFFYLSHFTKIHYDYYFGLFCLFVIGFGLILEYEKMIKVNDEIKIDLKTGIITELITTRRIHGLLLRERTLSTKNQIQYLDKSAKIICVANHVTIHFKKGKKLSIGFLKYDKEAIEDFVELINLVANHFSKHDTIDVDVSLW